MNNDDKLHNVVIVTALVLIAIVLYFVGGRAYRSWRFGPVATGGRGIRRP